jgi:hypothetical protein
LARCRATSSLALVLLAACAAHPQEDDAPQSPRHLACAGEVKQMQASCNPDLLRTQGSDCSAAADRIVDRCQGLR